MTEKEFLAAYDEYADGIFRFCYFRVFERELARDLTQEVFIKTWDQVRRGTKIKNSKAFLYTVARNIIIDNSRKKKPESLDALTVQGFDVIFSGGVLPEKLVDIKTALAALEKLDEKYREVVIMRYVEGHTPKDIAKILDESPNVISIRISRGLDKLREILGEAK